MDPPVSEPIDPRHMSAATEAADPPLEPPGIHVKSHGLQVGFIPEFSVDDPMANSSRFTLPTITAPAALSFFITVALYGGIKFSRIFDPQVVRIPFVQTISLMDKGMPVSGVTVPSAIA